MLLVKFHEVAEPEAMVGLAGIVLMIFLGRLSREPEIKPGRHALLVTAAGILSGLAVAAKPNALPIAILGMFWVWRVSARSRASYVLLHTLGAAVIPFVLFRLAGFGRRPGRRDGA
ncbi:MAG: hypothetical protein Q8R28_16655, partial [Dehalococcoidia bacterium]|nr:hypothetical protein [Dehalococcoidia bacterium]